MFDALVVKKITWLKSNQWQNKHFSLAGCGDVILVLTECIFATLKLDWTKMGRFFIKTDSEFKSCTAMTLQFNCKIQLSIFFTDWWIMRKGSELLKNECCSRRSHFRLRDLVRPETDSFCDFLFLFPLDIDCLGSYNASPKLPRFHTKKTIKLI